MKSTSAKTLIQFILIIATVSSCTKKREAQLPEDEQSQIFSLNEFPTSTEASKITIDKKSNNITNKLSQLLSPKEDSIKAIQFQKSDKLNLSEVEAPDKIKYMFDQLPLVNSRAKKFKVIFSLDKYFITAYKVVIDITELNTLEKGMLMQNKDGQLLVPLFKYEIKGYGVLDRIKNDLNEKTATLRLKESNFSEATHVRLSSTSDGRKMVGLSAQQIKQFESIYETSKIEYQITTAKKLSQKLKIGLNFLKPTDEIMPVFTDSSMLIYKVSSFKDLNEKNQRLVKNNAGNENIKYCKNVENNSDLKNKSDDCVIELVGRLPVNFKKAEMQNVDINGETSSDVNLVSVPRNQSLGLVEITENSLVERSEDYAHTIDPINTVRLKDLEGTFYFRRTLQDAATGFLGKTGTSGDMSLVRFEFEDQRLVVRNVKSLIYYKGQTAKDREEILSFPVSYLKLETKDNYGQNLKIPKITPTTKEKADYIKIDWAANTIPDATSPLAFYGIGSCMVSQSQNIVSDMDLKLDTEGKLNFSINKSFSVAPDCAQFKVTNSYFWSSMAQYNFNITERISFLKHSDKATDESFTLSMGPHQQAAFNFGLFTIADLDTSSNALNNREGSEIYKLTVHDFRNGKKVRWYLGGINDSNQTPADRRSILIEAAKEVINDWNDTLKYSFKGTMFERDGDYLELVIEEPGKETGRLGDLDKNYIWFNEIPAENGLLGVAQIAPNPKSGIIESANVIVYTGNSYRQANMLLQSSKVVRDYEKKLKEIYDAAVVESKNESNTTTTIQASSQTAAIKSNELKSGVIEIKSENTSGAIKENSSSKVLVQKIDYKPSAFLADRRVSAKLNSKLRQLISSTQMKKQIKVEDSEALLAHKLTELAIESRSFSDHKVFQFKANELFLKYARLSEDTRKELESNQTKLALQMQLTKSLAARNGCASEIREDINDKLLDLDTDEQKNLILNFKKNVKTTLAHELGHAFGLQHNFKGSADKANFKFSSDEKTDRNYSSIMDYMVDSDQVYAGPGPYDAHAIRAGYTGYVELSEQAVNDDQMKYKLEKEKVNLLNNKFIALNDYLKLTNTSTTDLAESALNGYGIIKIYERCNDMGLGKSALCAQFDVGGNATEIVNNLIQDYQRGYMIKNYVWDRINYSHMYKLNSIIANIRLFANIHSFLGESFKINFQQEFYTAADFEIKRKDLTNAANQGYMFFHELIRQPESDQLAMKESLTERTKPYIYSYIGAKLDQNGQPIKNANGEYTLVSKKSVKLLEARSLFDIDLTPNKFATLGISYDKNFALEFLTTASSLSQFKESEKGFFSYMLLERLNSDIEKPENSLIMQTIYDILTDQLRIGFFAPTGAFVQTEEPLTAFSRLSSSAAFAGTVGTVLSQWQAYDEFAESFKVGQAFVKHVPQQRTNVLKIGQDRSKSDSTVFFAGQNSKLAEKMILKAVRFERLNTLSNSLSDLISKLIIADEKVFAVIDKKTNNACAIDEDGDLKNKAHCDSESMKSFETHLKENPELVPLKKVADDIALQIAREIEKQNTDGLLNNSEINENLNLKNILDDIKYARLKVRSILVTSSFVAQKMSQQVSVARKNTYINFKLKNSDFYQKNLELRKKAVYAIFYEYAAREAEKVKYPTSDGEVMPVSVLSGLMIQGEYLKRTYESLAQSLSLLNYFTRLVDSDYANTL